MYVVAPVAAPRVSKLTDAPFWNEYTNQKYQYDRSVSPLLAQINALYGEPGKRFETFNTLLGEEKKSWGSENARRMASLAQRGLGSSGAQNLSDVGAAADLSQRVDRLSKDVGEQKVNALYQQALDARTAFQNAVAGLYNSALARGTQLGSGGLADLNAKPKPKPKPVKRPVRSVTATQRFGNRTGTVSYQQPVVAKNPVVKSLAELYAKGRK
jgi:hypothetical protein